MDINETKANRVERNSGDVRFIVKGTPDGSIRWSFTNIVCVICRKSIRIGTFPVTLGTYRKAIQYCILIVDKGKEILKVFKLIYSTVGTSGLL